MLLSLAFAVLLPLVACRHAAFETRIAALEVEADRQAVIRLIHQYAHGIDGHDPELLGRTFAADARAEYEGVNFPMSVRLDGLPAILAWLDAQVGQREGALPWHYMDTHLVEVDGDRATLKTYQHNRTLAGIGVYTVDAVRTPAGWRIAKLRLDERLLDPELIEQMKRKAQSPGARNESGAEEAEKRFVAALAGDLDALETILARDFVYSTTAGSILGKQALLDYLRAGTTRVEHITRDAVQRTERNGLVLTTGRLVTDIRQDGRASRIHSRYLHVWVETPQGWQLLARQAATLPSNPS